ncbi:hypothetical protein ACFOW9_14525 [Arthrobacter cryoconiti]|uniref:Uncharacterized protein n=1 Tax=Arthrobacter cryoconiti TaxID=748907 RepID=A0ABV8R475_9MICC|nr:hypothetical protein [Arthrobacter cryoconiti]MCC9067013.1 hypothetical protein [Arthrobacter cryoconiti]
MERPVAEGGGATAAEGAGDAAPYTPADGDALLLVGAVQPASIIEPVAITNKMDVRSSLPCFTLEPVRPLADPEFE